ncbi:MAG: iron-containing alcohol dehydrogenase [Candidatus Ratteibacteria bacterium]|jgi:alcohol dehydrogenase class IV
MVNNFCWHLPTEIIFGDDALANLKKKAQKFGKKVFLVTGKNFARESGLLDEIEFLLGEAELDVKVFSGAIQNPDTKTCEEGARICRKAGCDCIIAAGGGSAMDTAKSIAILATNPGRLKNYFGMEKASRPPLPIIAIPTTSGSGSEVTPYAVVIETGSKEKKTITCAGIYPRLSLVQPSLTLSLSGFLTASTGLDALSHAVEGALGKRITLLSLTIARETVKIIKEALPRVVNNPNDLEGREKMSLAAMMAGFVINQTSTIIAHGMGYPLTINYGVQHGTANSLVLPAIFEFLSGKGYRERIVEVTGWEDPVAGWRDFCRQINLPVSLREVGVKKGDLKKIAKEAVANCQRSMDNLGLLLAEKDFYEIYKNSY